MTPDDAHPPSDADALPVPDAGEGARLRSENARLRAELARLRSEAGTAAEAVERGAAWLRRAVTEAPFPVLLHAEDGAIVGVSRTFTELTGNAPDDVSTIEAWTLRAYGERHSVVQSEIDRLYALERRIDEGEYEIRHIRERLRLIGGTFHIQSGAGRGTRAEITAPSEIGAVLPTPVAPPDGS